MTIQTLQAEWTQSFKEALLSVERSITPMSNDDSELAGFKILSKWLMETPHNPYEFMPHGYESYRSNPFEANSILNLLHHALLDDGEVSFVKMTHKGEIVRVFMNFYWQHEDGFKEICIEENKSLIESIIEGSRVSQRLRDFITKKYPEKVLTEKPSSELKDFEFVAHRNPVQFIADVDAFQVAHELKQKAVEEKIRVFKSKM